LIKPPIKTLFAFILFYSVFGTLLYIEKITNGKSFLFYTLFALFVGANAYLFYIASQKKASPGIE